MASERELKFSTTGERRPTAAEIEAVLRSGGIRATFDGEQIQRDRYFDDAIGSLERAGLSLRRRNVAGLRLATLKSAGSVQGALHEREEIELPLAGTGWPDEIRAGIDGIVDPGTLRSRTTLVTRRERYLLSRGPGSELAVLSFDEVQANLPGGSQTVRFHEIEIEAREGTGSEELYRIAELLDRVVELTPSGTNKLERARALLDLATWGE